MINRSPAQNATLWGISISLSWMWGLGLFFSVQFSFQYGLWGLLSFAIPNALGLFLFGYGTQQMARRESALSFESRFLRWSLNHRFLLLLYQFIALGLTIFAIANYFFILFEGANRALYMGLAVLLLVTFAALLGEEFAIQSIKKSHLVQFVCILAGMAVLISQLKPFGNTANRLQANPFGFDMYWGYLVPILTGFLCGPWFDIQQWQRAVQINKEKTSIAKSYLIGSLIFISLLLFHGSLLLWVIEKGGGNLAKIGADGLTYGHHIIGQYLRDTATPLQFGAYSVFIFFCILSTLDSGYIALKYFLQNLVQSANHILFSIIPSKYLIKPSWFFILMLGVVGVAIRFQFELIYFMVFFGSFFIAATIVGVHQFAKNTRYDGYPSEKLFEIGCVTLAIAGFGYFRQVPFLLTLGSIIPVAYSLYFITRGKVEKEVPVETDTGLPATGFAVPAMYAAGRPLEASEVLSAGASEYMIDKWYHYEFTATYSDTNSVGNVYFAQYAVWVGKTRELMFNHFMPDFDLKNTSYLILTRSYEHKFMREAREFERIVIKVRLKSFNRKFATLEHQILDTSGNLYGTGSQNLFFVRADTYAQIDIPQEIHKGMIQFLA